MTGWLESQEAALVQVENCMKDTLMGIDIIYCWKALVMAFSFLLFTSYKRWKSCSISEMCHGTSVL
jgi:hypothetical protein